MVFRCISDRDAHRFSLNQIVFTLLSYIWYFYIKRKVQGALFPSMYERSYSEGVNKYFGLKIQQKDTIEIVSNR